MIGWSSVQTAGLGAMPFTVEMGQASLPAGMDDFMDTLYSGSAKHLDPTRFMYHVVVLSLVHDDQRSWFASLIDRGAAADAASQSTQIVQDRLVPTERIPAVLNARLRGDGFEHRIRLRRIGTEAGMGDHLDSALLRFLRGLASLVASNVQDAQGGPSLPDLRMTAEVALLAGRVLAGTA